MYSTVQHTCTVRHTCTVWHTTAHVYSTAHYGTRVQYHTRVLVLRSQTPFRHVILPSEMAERSLAMRDYTCTQSRIYRESCDMTIWSREIMSTILCPVVHNLHYPGNPKIVVLFSHCLQNALLLRLGMEQCKCALTQDYTEPQSKTTLHTCKVPQN